MSEATAYEFSKTQNSVFSDLASKMRFVGAVSIALGVVTGLAAIAAALTGFPGAGVAIYVLQALVSIWIGSWTRSGASAFQGIVDTQGSDIAHLMTAIEALRRVYGLQRAILVVAILGAIGAFLVLTMASGFRTVGG